jgi:nickel-dependent lactate racemase
MMKVHLKYGKNGLNFDLPENLNFTILKSKQEKEILNPVEEIKEKINKPIGTLPLKKLIQKIPNFERISIIVVISDATRPSPSKIMLTALFEVFEEIGIRDDQVKILIATGLHRESRHEELERMIGEAFLKRFEVINHKANDESALVFVGYSNNGTPIYVNTYYLDSDFKILTGYVEPHFFSGFSGGRKSIVPGIAGEKTIISNHSAKNIASPHARFGVFKENPLHINAVEIAKRVGVDFIINVCINENHNITRIAAGDLEKAHEELVNYQLKQIFQTINLFYDIVICGNGGFPLDCNLYQAVKSMALGEMAVRKGGIIISVNELSEGIGHEKFRELIFSGRTPKDIYEDIVNEKIKVVDQWEIQILTRVLQKAEIIVVSTLSKDELGNIGLIHANSVEEAVEMALEKVGSNAQILVLPDGSLVLPKL